MDFFGDDNFRDYVVINHYAEGLTVRAIGKLIGISFMTVLRILDRNNIKRRSGGRRKATDGLTCDQCYRKKLRQNPEKYQQQLFRRYVQDDPKVLRAAISYLKKFQFPTN
jgi:transposase